jgi:hypothetical protein
MKSALQEACQALKVFPLPSVVLFPGTAMPLHIFEPRYRDLVRDCLASDKVMALVDLQPGWESQYEGRPALRPIGCAGRIVWHEELPDGRSNIMLHGDVRVLLREELPAEHAYREVRAEVLEDPPYAGPLEEMLRQAVLEIAGRIPEELGTGMVHSAVRSNGGGLADVVAAAMVQDVDRRKALLSELDPAARLTQVLDEVGELIARLGPATPGGPLN